VARGHSAMEEKRTMGTYLFERDNIDGAGHGAGASLLEDVTKALLEIDWVDSFSVLEERSDDDVVSVDILFDADWPDIRTGNPDHVGEVFHRLGLRTIPNPTLASRQASADDPLSAERSTSDDAEGLDLFQFED